MLAGNDFLLVRRSTDLLLVWVLVVDLVYTEQLRDHSSKGYDCFLTLRLLSVDAKLTCSRRSWATRMSVESPPDAR